MHLICSPVYSQLDCLEYIHENEYVHGDITAENIYLNPADLTQVGSRSSTARKGHWRWDCDMG